MLLKNVHHSNAHQVFADHQEECLTSWSRTIAVKQSKALNRRRIAEQLPPLIGLLIGLQFLKFREKETFFRKTAFAIRGSKWF